MPAHKSCRIEYSFRWKRNYRHTYRNLPMRWKINKKLTFFGFSNAKERDKERERMQCFMKKKDISLLDVDNVETTGVRCCHLS